MIHVCQGNQGIVYLACDQDEKMEAVSAAPGVIDELFVSEPYRGQHIGKQLLESIEMYLRNKGCTMVRLPVFAPNILAHNFYQRAGYVERLIIMIKPLN
jgi:GNAT superfamily N-acetyltransferase